MSEQKTITETQTTLDQHVASARAIALEPLVEAIGYGEGRTPDRARRLMEVCAELGLVVLRVSDVQQLGEMGNTCTWDRTGEVCPYCRCGRKT